MFWGLLVIAERSFSWLKTEVCPDVRAQEKRLAKFPIKMKVEDLVAYVIQQNWGNVAASVEIMPQILATKKANTDLLMPYSRCPPKLPPLWAQRRANSALGDPGNSPSSSPSFFPWCLLPPLITALILQHLLIPPATALGKETKVEINFSLDPEQRLHCWFPVTHHLMNGKGEMARKRR